MSNVLDNILQQKLMEIQSSLPSYVKIVRQPSIPFNELLEGEIAGTDINSAISSFNYDGNFEDLINEASRKYNISSNIIKAVIKAESNFNPEAISKAGARGLMQLMPGTADGLGVKNSFDPKQNIEGGVKYLKGMLEEFDGNLELALAAYNAGPYNVKKYGGIPPFEETQNYVKKIMSWLRNKTP